MKDLLIYGAPAYTALFGYLWGAHAGKADVIAKLKHWEGAASNNWKRFVDAARECNNLEDSNNRLSDQLTAKSARLERIASHFENQQSGTARLVVKMATGEA